MKVVPAFGILLALSLVVSLPARAVSSTVVPTPSAGVSSTITNFDASGNQIVRFDVDGQAVDAHEGQLALFGDTYYFYGTSFGCGWVYWSNTRYCGFKAYSSPDLVHWTDHGYLFDAQSDYWQSGCRGPFGCFRPRVIYDANTGRYVLWFNANQNSDSSGYHVFDSTSPTGPFVERASPTLAVSYVDGVNGDENLFVDDDGTAYLIYTDWTNTGDIIVEQLDSTDETGTGRFVRLGLNRTEAPAMFKRNGRYYITVSDPNCPYCTTGTAYMTAPTPLGPWSGAGAPPQDYWHVQDGVLTVNGGNGGLSAPGRDWADYRFSFDTTPLTTTSGAAAETGWLVRAHDAANAYLWQVSAAGGGTLVKSILTGGQSQEIGSPVTLAPALHIQAGQSYHVEMDVAGQSITTTIDGQVVDVTQDATYTQGRVGFYESAADGAAATFDNAQVTLPDGTTALTDTFSVTDTSSTSAEPFQFDPPLQPRTPIMLSTDSCGGQPTSVTAVPSTDGPLYLYQSDLWHNGGRNEGLANYYWGPLSFNADGSIQPITCTPSFTADLTVGAPGSQDIPPDLDQTSGFDNFRTACDIGGSVERLQTFVPSRTGLLTNVSVATFQDWTIYPFPSAPLLVDVVTVDGTTPSFPLARVAVPTDNVPWAAGDVTVQPNVMVTAGRQYGILVHTASPQGCYGFAFNDANPYPSGTELRSGDSGATFTVEPGRALQFAVTVASNSSIPTSTPFPTNTLPPSATSTSTNTPLATATPTATGTTPPTPSSTPSSTATSTTTPVESATPAPTGTPTAVRRRPATPPFPLALASVPASVAAGQSLRLVARTAPQAQVDVTLEVTATKVIQHGSGKARTVHRHTTVLYRIARHGRADKQGRFSTRVPITYKPPKPVAAHLTVQARTTHGHAVRTYTVTIRPPVTHRARAKVASLPLVVTSTPRTVASHRKLTVSVRTAPHAHVGITLTVVTTRIVVRGRGKARTRHRQSVVLYRATGQATANRHGDCAIHLRVTYAPVRAVVARLAIHAWTLHGSGERVLAVTIRPHP